MRRITASLFVLLSISLSATAQKLPAAHEAEAHVCSLQRFTAQEWEALESYHRAREAGLLPAAHKAGSMVVLDDTMAFNVQIQTVESGQQWGALRFVLKAENDIARIWVEAGQLRNEIVTTEHIEALREALLEKTPENSINPQAGIIANNNAIFGPPPNYDGDGKVDVLVYDISDPDIAGFVTSVDIWPDAPAGVGNQADVLYLDTYYLRNPVTAPLLLNVAAHEYTHLIHFSHDLNPWREGVPKEHIFVSEGLAEYGTLLNGFYSGFYPNQMSEETERNIPLFMWRDYPASLNDYTRAGLFFAYYGDRFGAEAVGKVLLNEKPEVQGLQEELGKLGTTLSEFLIDFHTANYVRNPSVDDRFGYKDPQLATVGAEIDPVYVIRGNEANSSPEKTLVIRGGGADYVVWEDVSDFELNLSATQQGSTPEGLKTSARARMVLEGRAGQTEVVELQPGEGPFLFPGDFRRVSLIVAHAQPYAFGASDVRFRYSASWTSDITARSVIYDQGKVDVFTETRYLNAFTRQDAPNVLVATKFTVPEGGVLNTVSLPVYYENQLSAKVPPDAPRDFELVIWDVAASGQPGEELFSLRVDDPRPYAPASGDGLEFAQVFLHEYAERFAGLPGTIFIGYREAGSDNNYLRIPVSNYESENLSFLGNSVTGTWNTLWSLKYLDIALSGKVVPVRAAFSFEVSTDAESIAEVPDRITLEQNYPNPFNPSTRIRYTLTHAMPVTLTVFDILGRKVATLVNGPMPAGTHDINLDTSEWSSGVYVYTLNTAERHYTRKMLLLR